MKEALKKFYSEGIDCKGRTNRKDFWFAILGLVLVYLGVLLLSGVIIGICMSIFGDKSFAVNVITTIIVIIISIWAIVSSWALLMMEIRRLHDINKSGWWILLCLIPICDLVLLAFFVSESVDEGNRFNN